jgi:hypothetical protein
LGEGLLVELRLYPQEPFFGPLRNFEVEGRHDGRWAFFASEPDRVFGRLLEHLAVLVRNEDPGPSLSFGRMLATFELGEDHEREPFAVFAGPELVEYPE